ncbi:hypothetical protein A6R68_19587, partial [Neotoma lepida]
DITQYLLAKRKQLEKDINANFRGLNENLQTQQQMKTLQKAVEDHETKIENAKDLCDTFLKVWWIVLVIRTHPFMSHQKAKDFSEHCKAFIGGEESEVKKEISKAQDRVIME